MNASTTKLAVVPAGVSLPANPGKTPAARINYRYRQYNEYGALAIMAALEVGRELLSVRDKLPHGEWRKWIEKNLEFSHDTADNFIKMFAKSVGEERAALPEPVGLETPVSADEYAAVTEKYPASSPTAFLKALVSADRSSNWGGDRRAAAAANGKRVGRHPKGGEGGEAAAEAAELDAIANNPALLYAAIRGPLDELWKLHRERDVFARLGLEELANVQAVLRDLADAATGALDARHALV